MKKILCLLLALVMCLGLLAACGETEEDWDDYHIEDMDQGLLGNINETEDSEETTKNTEPSTQPPVQGFALDVQSVTLSSMGETSSVYSGQNAEEIYWYSEDSSIAAVHAGVVTALGEGTTTVHGVYNGKDVTCSVTCNVSYGTSQTPVMKAPTKAMVDASFFDDAVFVGDSISLKLSYDTTGKLGNAQFLVQGSYGVGNAIFDLLTTDYRGETYEDLEDAIAATGAKKLFIMMGMNDIGLYGIDDTIKNWGTLLGLIREACPGIQIYIQSMTPVWTGGEKGGLTNPNINEYNVKLRVFAEENGCGFIDVAPFMRDATGGLATDYCSDKYVHLTEAGVSLWISVLKAYPCYQ